MDPVAKVVRVRTGYVLIQNLSGANRDVEEGGRRRPPHQVLSW
jgi:hypothetical protein